MPLSPRAEAAQQPHRHTARLVPAWQLSPLGATHIAVHGDNIAPRYNSVLYAGRISAAGQRANLGGTTPLGLAPWRGQNTARGVVGKAIAPGQGIVDLGLLTGSQTLPLVHFYSMQGRCGQTKHRDNIEYDTLHPRHSFLLFQVSSAHNAH